MVGLTVSPEISLVDEPVKIQAWGLLPRQVITLKAWLKDEKGQIFHSRAFYKADMEGKVDLEKSPATGGDFQGVCPMGLFWALKPNIPLKKLIKRDVVGSPFLVHLELYSSLEFDSREIFPAATKVVERWYAAPGVQRILIREGRIRGALFLPPGEGPFPGVIDMFGGVGGLLEFRSSLLASRGFASLALAYFAYDDLPIFLGEVDLKYFEEAAEFLCNHPKVSGDGVGVVAVCKGAEIALAMASYLPQVAAIVCINGTNAVNGVNLVYGDRLLMKAIPYKMERLLSTEFLSFSVANIMDDPRKPEYQDSILPLEKARGPILFLVGNKDQHYNSLFFVREAKSRAEKYGKKDVYVQCYPGAGHLLEPPGAPFCPFSQGSFFPLPLAWGGELLPHCRAQETSWKEIQEFFSRNIRCSRRNKL